MNTQTLEQTKEQIKQIETKIEELNKVIALVSRLTFSYYYYFSYI